MKQCVAIAGLIIVTIIWGGGFVASDMALESFTPFQIMAIRFFLGALILSSLSVQHMKKLKRKETYGGILMGCALFGAFTLQTIGLQYTTPSKNAFLTSINVVIVPFIAFLVNRKLVKIRAIIGGILAVLGVGVLSITEGFFIGAGDILTLLCAVCFAFQIFLTGEFAGKYRVVVLNSVQMLTAFILSIIFLILSIISGVEIVIPSSPKGWFSVLYLGIVSTAITYLLQTNCQKYVDETKSAIILSMEAVFGTLFSIILLGERITIRMVIGCSLILLAVILANKTEIKEERAR